MHLKPLVPFFVVTFVALFARPVRGFLFFLASLLVFKVVLWSSCHGLGWLLFQRCSANGGSVTQINCPGGFLYNGQCHGYTKVCDAPQSQPVASPNGPCTCVLPGTSVASPNRVCPMPPSNGFSVFCRNANNGASSSCDATCAPGYVYINGVCAREKITNTYCMSLVPPRRPGLIGPSASNLNQCECVLPSAISPTSRPCPGFQSTTVPPNGEMSCQQSLSVPARCIPSCTSGSPSLLSCV